MGEVVAFPQREREPEPEYITVAEYARITGINRATVYRAVQDGTLPHIRVRRTIRIPRLATRIDSRPSWYRSTPGFGTPLEGA